MFKSVILWLSRLLMLMAVFVTQATAKDSQSIDEVSIPLLGAINQEMTFFYTDPRRQVFNHVQERILLLEKPLTETNPTAMWLMATWVYRVSTQYDWPVQATFYPQVMAQFADKNSRVGQLIRYQGSEVNSPEYLDIWWVSYFATGDNDYLMLLLEVAKQAPKLKKINESKAGNKQLTQQDLMPYLTAEAAQWSWLSNCHQHPAIRQFATEQLDIADNHTERKRLLVACQSAK